MSTVSCPCCRLVLGHRALASEYCPRCLVRRRTAVRLIPGQDDTGGPVRAANNAPIATAVRRARAGAAATGHIEPLRCR